MTLQKTFLLAGMTVVLSVYAMANFLSFGASDASLPVQQSLVIDTGLLVRQEKMQESCFAAGCHQTIKPQDAVSIHKPFAEGRCEICHAPAAHLQQITLTTKDQIDLCYECHSAKLTDNSHVVGKDAIDPNTGKPMTCSSCHSPHHTEKSSLLKMDGRGELCLSCHVKFLSTK